MRISDWSSDVCSSDLAAVDQLARRRRRATAPVTLLDQRHRQTAAGRVIRGPCAIDTATDDQQIELTSGQCSRVADKRKSGSHEHFWLRKCEPRTSRITWGILTAIRSPRVAPQALYRGRSEERRVGKEGVSEVRSR